jgi:hypothetical protein
MNVTLAQIIEERNQDLHLLVDDLKTLESMQRDITAMVDQQGIDVDQVSALTSHKTLSYRQCPRSIKQFVDIALISSYFVFTSPCDVCVTTAERASDIDSSSSSESRSSRARESRAICEESKNEVDHHWRCSVSHSCWNHSHRTVASWHPLILNHSTLPFAIAHEEKNVSIKQRKSDAGNRKVGSEVVRWFIFLRACARVIGLCTGLDLIRFWLFEDQRTSKRTNQSTNEQTNESINE